MQDTLGKMEESNQVHESLERLYDLAETRFKLKRSPAELAKLLDESAQTIHNWSGERGVSKQGAQKCQRLYGWSALWIREGLEPRYIGGDDWPPELDKLTALRGRRITVLGEIRSDDEGRLSWHDFSNEKARREVIAVTGNITGHGLLVATNALQPRYRMGETLVIAEAIEAEAGSDVLIFLIDGPLLVKQFMFRRGGMATVSGICAHDQYQQMTLRQSEIKSMCPVISVCGIQASPPDDD